MKTHRADGTHYYHAHKTAKHVRALLGPVRPKQAREKLHDGSSRDRIVHYHTIGVTPEKIASIMHCHIVDVLETIDLHHGVRFFPEGFPNGSR